ncbi:hypothetical protein [Haliea sp.]|jgi:5-methylcytosine-specific restriction enzyme subunit McrC|uniref:McrC family protein n=1 Tax=Haliea sp. TaxID=1932666 RepID=UPI000C612198|nr:hypothetical protein [Haliea sp.]MAD63852.1 restriction endonuclease [Haliea sp.]MAY92213.1 restriction endonuclease [Haliea sp.]MBK42137.1 restriction endonuclease [Haliea sp.]MBP69803.1 restriction endonuclease [Haliea sp.]|tara:strand:- start:3384 stop:4661 length:1278 start_codon:yes stop_codon:yes gene_type:complete
MRVEQAEERSEIDIPISEIVRDGGSLNILPTVKNYFSIDYKPRTQKLSLVAGGYIGLIPINTELAIEIRPKFSIANLTRVVSVAEDKFRTLEFFNRKYREVEDASPVVLEFLAKCLVTELRAVFEEGVLKEYLPKSEISTRIRGRLSIDRSVKHLWSKGLFHRAHTTYHEFTADNAFNRLLKYTLRFCIEELDLIESESLQLRERLIDYYTMFDQVALDENLRCLDEVSMAIANQKVSVLRSYYINLCEICRLIITKKGVSFDETGSDLELSSFILDMALTFEKYLLNSLRQHRDKLPGDAIVLDGNAEGRKKFYNQPSVGKGDAKPDIVLKTGNRNAVIADAKYKSKSKDTDRYQVISHALSFDSKVAVLILPRDSSYNGDRLVKLGGVGVQSPVDVFEYYFDLSSEDLVKEEEDLAKCLSSLC